MQKTIMRISDVRVEDSIFDPARSERKVHVKRRGKTALYKVFLYLSGMDLPFVQQVTYRLHPTFPNPEQTVRRTAANPNCQLIIWTWGVFTLQAVVMDKNGNTIQLEHTLQFDKQLKEVDSGDFEWE